MCICARRSVAAALFVTLLLPAAAYAQAAITGVVRDTSGAVLPGVTVEAASPVLIERTRSVVSDDTGQYRIVDLRPGTYSVTFTLPGFNTVKREGIELTGDFVATVTAELRVGALEETVTVTGESPTVDVQSTRVQNIVDKEVLAAIPSSRGATGIQSLVPGMSSNGDAGGITGGSGGMAGFIHGARASDSRTLHDGINTGWAGANSNAAVSNVAGSQETVLTVSGGLGEAETAGAMLNIIPRDGGNQFSGTMFVSGASGGMQGSNYTDDLRAAGLRSPAELKKVYDFNPMGGGRIIRGQIVVLPDVPRGCRREHDSGHLLQPERRRSDQMARRLRHQPSLLRGQRDPKCDRATHLAGVTAQQSEFQPLPAVRQTEQGRRRHCDANTRSAGPETLHAWVHSDSDMGITHHQPVAGRGRLGQLLLRVRQPGATGRWHAQPRSDLDPRAVLRRLLRTTAASPG